jgi:uroporphyrinogen decarboxylase
MTAPPNSINRKALFLRACRSEPVERVPVWMMRQAGRYLPEYRAIREKHSFLEVAKTPDLAAEVSLQPYRRLGVDAVIVFSDILIPAEAMGVAIQLGDGGPVIDSPVRTTVQVEALRQFDPARETRFLGDAISQLCRALGPDVPVLGFAAAPWTLACYLVQGQSHDGFPAAKIMMLSEPRIFRRLLETIARATAAYLRAQIAAGATAVQLFDTWAGELDFASYREFEWPATQLLISELATDVPVILYSKNSGHLLDLLATTGANVLSVDWRQDLAALRQRFGRRVALQGNVDPCVLLAPKDVIAQAVRAAVEQTQGLGHILNLGHGILRETPVEHAQEFVRAGQSAPVAAAAQAKLLHETPSPSKPSTAKRSSVTLP